MLGHFASPTIRQGSALGRVSVTKTDLVGSWNAGVPVTLTNALAPFVGALGARLDALFRQVSPQNRADRRLGLNWPPQWAQAILWTIAAWISTAIVWRVTPQAQLGPALSLAKQWAPASIAQTESF